MEKHSNTIETNESNEPCFLRSEAELDRFLAAWRAGTLPKSEWTHVAHVAVAACHLFYRPQEKALEEIRAGIIHYNACVGTANTDHSGYHETLTRFWTGLIADLLGTGTLSSRLAFVRAAVRTLGGDSALFRRYYSFDVVKDVRARREWIAPDRGPQAKF